MFAARVQPRINTYHLNHPCTQFVPRGKVSFHRQPKPMNPHYTQQPSYDIDRKIKSEIINTFKDTTWVPPLWPRLRRMTRFAYVLISIKLTNFKATIHDNLLGPYIKEAYILIDGFSCNNHIPMSSLKVSFELMNTLRTYQCGVESYVDYLCCNLGGYL